MVWVVGSPAGTMIHITRGLVSNCLDELLERVGADRALRHVRLDRVGRPVERDHAVAALQQAQDHVAAHAAQADHPHLHGCVLPSACYLTGGLDRRRQRLPPRRRHRGRGSRAAPAGGAR